MMITVVTTRMEMMIIIIITIHAGRIAGSGCAESSGEDAQQAARTSTVE